MCKNADLVTDIGFHRSVYTAIINLCRRNKNIDGNKNKLRTIEAQIVQKRKNNEPQPKFIGSYKKEACILRISGLSYFIKQQ